MSSRIRALTQEILVVEDERHDASGVAEALRSDGHRVIRFANGIVALTHLHARLHDGLALPDVLVSDLALRGITGLQVVASLREVGWTKPAILLVASVSREMQEMARAVGGTFVQERPLDLDALRALVIRCIESRGVAHDDATDSNVSHAPARPGSRR
ncbi:MAG TPA: response regulator [Polyangiaceae bacterium]|jgi:CheY-like chemotaxis protein